MIGQGTAKRMTDAELVAAYLDDERKSDFGVNYYLAQEMEARGFRNPRTGALTASAYRALGREDN